MATSMEIAKIGRLSLLTLRAKCQVAGVRAKVDPGTHRRHVNAVHGERVSLVGDAPKGGNGRVTLADEAIHELRHSGNRVDSVKIPGEDTPAYRGGSSLHRDLIVGKTHVLKRTSVAVEEDAEEEASHRSVADLGIAARYFHPRVRRGGAGTGIRATAAHAASLKEEAVEVQADASGRDFNRRDVESVGIEADRAQITAEPVTARRGDRHRKTGRIARRHAAGQSAVLVDQDHPIDGGGGAGREQQEDKR